jgi:hypothetical protein
MLNDYASKNDWLKAVAADDTLGRLALRAAITLAVYFNNSSGRAWPSIARLATELKADRRNLQRALDTLVRAGLIDRKRGGRGRGNSNSYWRAKGGKTDRPKDETVRAVNSTLKGRSGLPPNKTKNLRIEEAPYGAVAAAASSRSLNAASQKANHRSTSDLQERRSSQRPYNKDKQADRNARNRGEPFPEHWVLGNNELKDAAQIAQWGYERAELEFEKFREWHDEHETRRQKWNYAWRNWCRKGAEIDQRSPSKQQSRTGLSSAIEGAREWLDLQKR